MYIHRVAKLVLDENIGRIRVHGRTTQELKHNNYLRVTRPDQVVHKHVQSPVYFGDASFLTSPESYTSKISGFL